ncbi:MAG TPA: SURF1 family protein [Macromonas sp.]|nr:SURF1 family protein [Macromonas sp.]
MDKSFWVITLATLLGCWATASLGQWQLGRAAQKEAHARQLLTRGQMPPLGWLDLQAQAQGSNAAALFERRVRLSGHWLAAAPIYLDNRPLNGRAGYWVLMPFKPQDAAAPALLVVRGWAPRQADLRGAVPVLPAESGVVLLEGQLAAAPSKLYELGPDSTGQVRQNVDLAALAQEWATPLLPVAVWQTGATGLPQGWSREWPVPNADVHKHYGYAVQWFGLCALMVMLYVWFQFIAPRRSGR